LTLDAVETRETVDRLIDVFPAAQQEQIRIQIAGSLQGVVTQTLVPTADGTGRVPAVEILFPDDAVRNLIRQAKVEQVYSIMQTGTSRGMMTLEQSLAAPIIYAFRDPFVFRDPTDDQVYMLFEGNVAGENPVAGTKTCGRREVGPVPPGQGGGIRQWTP
jgi:hypothetical protein